MKETKNPPTALTALNQSYQPRSIALTPVLFIKRKEEKKPSAELLSHIYKPQAYIPHVYNIKSTNPLLSSPPHHSKPINLILIPQIPLPRRQFPNLPTRGHLSRRRRSKPALMIQAQRIEFEQRRAAIVQCRRLLIMMRFLSRPRRRLRL